MGLRCKRCGGEEHVKNGLMRGHQRYLCKSCGLTFTDTPARGKPLALKAAAVLLYVSGLSMNRTAKLLGVFHAHHPGLAGAVCGRLRAEARAGGPGRGDRARRDVALSKKSPSRSGSGRLGIVLQASWWTGNAAVVTKSPASA